MDVVKQIEVAPFECPAVILPTPANMKQLCMELAAMPSKILAMLEVQAATMAQNEIDGLLDEVEKLREVVDIILEVTGAPNLQSIDWPSLRAEIGIDKLFQKFPTYTMAMMIELIMILDIQITYKHLKNIRTTKILQIRCFQMELQNLREINLMMLKQKRKKKNTLTKIKI